MIKEQGGRARGSKEGDREVGRTIRGEEGARRSHLRTDRRGDITIKELCFGDYDGGYWATRAPSRHCATSMSVGDTR